LAKDLLAQRPRFRRIRRAIVVATWAVLAVNVAVWLGLKAGDTWGPVTFLMFGPRWPFAILPVLFVGTAILLDRRLLYPAGAALVVAAGPLAGFNVPWDQLASESAGGPRVRVLTCNAHYARVDSAALDRLVAEEKPDLVALQEWRTSNQAAFLTEPGWHVRPKAGLLLASRYPVSDLDVLGGEADGEPGKAVRYDLDTPGGRVTLVSLHLASPRGELRQVAEAAGARLEDIDRNSELRGRQSAAIVGKLEGLAGPLLIVGDFNTPPESVQFRGIWSPYRDAFADAGWGWGYTFFNRWTRVRIDHILVGGGGRATACWVGPDIGSPHRPVIADVAWPLDGR
jgi:vancomycin resistance protein VanJ